MQNQTRSSVQHFPEGGFSNMGLRGEANCLFGGVSTVFAKDCAVVSTEGCDTVALVACHSESYWWV